MTSDCFVVYEDNSRSLGVEMLIASQIVLIRVYMLFQILPSNFDYVVHIV